MFSSIALDKDLRGQTHKQENMVGREIAFFTPAETLVPLTMKNTPASKPRFLFHS